MCPFFDSSKYDTDSESQYILKKISSHSNPTFKLLRSLLESRGIRKHNRALLSGKRIIDEALAAYPERCLALVAKEGAEILDLSSTRLPDSFTRYQLDRQLFDEIDVWNATDYLLLVEVGEFPAWNSKKTSQGCTLFIPFQDPSNVGAVIRSAAAFSVSSIVLLEEAAHPFHPKSIRSASGNLFTVPIFTGPSISELDTGDLKLIVLDMDGENISSFKPPDKFGLLCGIEGPGIPEKIKSLKNVRRTRIPINESVESLNAAVATSIALYILQNKL